MSQDLNAQNSGIKAVNSGPLVIRTYNDLSGNNTYMVGQYDKAISSNYVLTTSTGGLLVPTNAVQVSSINVSTLVMGNATFSTLTGSTLSTNTLVVTSSLTVSTISSLNSWNNFFVNNSTITGSTISGRLVGYSTLIGSTISTNTITVTSTLTGSTLIVNGPITCNGIYYGYNTLIAPATTQLGYTISATIGANSGTTTSNFAPLNITVGVWLVTFFITFTSMNTFPNTVITIVGGPATSYPILTSVTANTGVGMGTYTYNSSGSVTLGLSVVNASSPITVASSYYTATRIA